MKHIILFSAFIIVLTLAGTSNAQTTGMFRLTFAGSTTASGTHTGTIKFTGLENPNIRLLEAVIPATSEAACFASTDFPNAVPIGPDRATVSYDYATGMYKVIWINQGEIPNTCRVLIGDGDIDGHDFLIWRRSELPSSARQDNSQLIYTWTVTGAR